MTGICRLCLNRNPLCLSHIFPRFVVLWLKKTSATGYLRHAVSPSQRDQEGAREYLLCSNCEQILSRDEKMFAEQVFFPYHERAETNFKYGQWLKRFLVGLHWKVLVMGPPDRLGRASELYNRAMEDWRNYLRGESQDHGLGEFHIFFGDVVQHAASQIPSKLNWYFNRSLDATPFSSESGTAGTYVKIVKVMTFCFLTPRDPKKERWEGTQVLDNGTLRTPQQVHTTGLGPFFKERVAIGEEAASKISARQKTRIAESVIRNPQRALSSESYRTHLAEKRLRQRDEREQKLREVGMKGRDRNKSCPCGSGVKWKNCHGR